MTDRASISWRRHTPVVLTAALTVVFTLAAAPAVVIAATKNDSADTARFLSLYKTLVEIDTTRSNGDCTRAAEAMRDRLRDGGLPDADIRLLVPPDRPRDGALIATLQGRDRALKPILLLAHIDVVEAKREDWQRDPFILVREKDDAGTEWFYARGASDDKAMAAVFTDSLIRYRQAGYIPRRSLKLALTCGEETPDVFNGVEWLLREHPDTLDAVFALNEGASGELDADGRHLNLQIQAGEKVYQDFELRTSDVGGHSSRPTHSNPIHRISAALARFAKHRFPVQLNPVTRAYFQRQLQLSPQSAATIRAVLDGDNVEAAADQLWQDNPGWNSMLRTTCTTTTITGGHAANALPQQVRANVNCRILPGTPIESVREQIIHALGDDNITVTAIGPPALTAPLPELNARILNPARDVAKHLWPGVALLPTLATGATDGRFLNAAGIPTYGLSGIFHDAEGSRAHGLNERIRVRALLDSRDFLHAVIQRYAER